MPAAVRNHAKGAVWGALLGDAAGVTLEFFPKKITLRDVRWAMTFPGGGVFHVGPGQISDDGEMTLALWHALFRSARADQLAAEAAQQYRAWFRSRPFDIGQTTRNAVSDTGTTAASMRDRAAAMNPLSMSNGSLMRCSPMALAALRWKWTAFELEEQVRAEASLTHSNEVVQWAQIAYVAALAYLCRHPQDGDGALRTAARFVKKSHSAELQEWWRRAQDRTPLSDAHQKIGWIRHGWITAFQHLRQGSDWATAVRATLLLGGDTDTNAAIVGAMVGALHGFEALPADALAAVAKPPGSLHHPRPGWLHPSGMWPHAGQSRFSL